MLVQHAFHIALSFGDAGSDLCASARRIQGNSTTPVEFVSAIFTFRKYIPLEIRLEVPTWSNVPLEPCR